MVRAIPAPDLSRTGEDVAQPLIGCERLPRHESDGGQLTGTLCVERLDRFLLQQLVDLLVEGEVVAVHGVEDLFGNVDELVARGCRCLAERVDPGLLDPRHATKCPQDHPVGVRGAVVDEVAIWNLAGVSGREEQVPAALAAVGAGDAHVGYVAEPKSSTTHSD
jgi:hypothetical protein